MGRSRSTRFMLQERMKARRTIMDDPIDRARTAVKDRAELPGMSLMEHLEELRKRLIHTVAYLLVGFAVAYAFHERLFGYIQKPLDDLGIALNYTHPTDPLNLYLKTAFVGWVYPGQPVHSVPGLVVYFAGNVCE